jgi:glycosyltransferase involved in cell wall biosynthesis
MRVPVPADPELSIVIPCYNEEGDLPLSMPPLFAALRRLGLRHEIVLVNNGSQDRTAELIDGFAETEPVRRVDVPVNEGYGLGVITGLRAARGELVCQMWADAQVSADDVVETIAIARATRPGTLVKVRRIEREDGVVRKVISFTWNNIFERAFRGGGVDVNGCPKIYHRGDLALLDLECKDSFLDAEAIIKARMLKMRIIEVPVHFYARAGGASKIKLLRYSASFLENVARYRFGDRLTAWRAQVEARKSEEPMSRTTTESVAS